MKAICQSRAEDSWEGRLDMAPFSVFALKPCPSPCQRRLGYQCWGILRVCERPCTDC
jgi:hypothetical protein